MIVLFIFAVRFQAFVQETLEHSLAKPGMREILPVLLETILLADCLLVLTFFEN